MTIDKSSICYPTIRRFEKVNYTDTNINNFVQNELIIYFFSYFKNKQNIKIRLKMVIFCLFNYYFLIYVFLLKIFVYE